MPSCHSQFSRGPKELVNSYSVPCALVASVQRATVMQGEVVTQAFPEEVTFHEGSKDEQQLASSHPVPMTTKGWIGVAYAGVKMTRIKKCQKLRQRMTQRRSFEILIFFTETRRCSFLQVRELLSHKNDCRGDRSTASPLPARHCRPDLPAARASSAGEGHPACSLSSLVATCFWCQCPIGKAENEEPRGPDPRSVTT